MMLGAGMRERSGSGSLVEMQERRRQAGGSGRSKKKAKKPSRRTGFRILRAAEKAYWVMVSRCPCLKYDQSGNQRAAADAAEARERIFVAVALEIAPDYPSWGDSMTTSTRSSSHVSAMQKRSTKWALKDLRRGGLNIRGVQTAVRFGFRTAVRPTDVRCRRLKTWQRKRQMSRRCPE
jgi:hypothetical protein